LGCVGAPVGHRFADDVAWAAARWVRPHSCPPRMALALRSSPAPAFSPERSPGLPGSSPQHCIRREEFLQRWNTYRGEEEKE
jgi:hypothetical protein